MFIAECTVQGLRLRHVKATAISMYRSSHDATTRLSREKVCSGVFWIVSRHSIFIKRDVKIALVDLSRMK